MASSSHVDSAWQFSAFLCHRGPDTKLNIASHLHKALDSAGFPSFLDSKSLDPAPPSRKNLNGVILDAIHGSAVHIVVFSPNFTGSTACLDELSEMMACRREGRPSCFLPVFVQDVEPMHFRSPWLDDPSFCNIPAADAFKKLIDKLAANEEGKSIVEQKMGMWKEALQESSYLSGYTLRDASGDESVLVEMIVWKVQQLLNRDYKLEVATHPVGIEEQLRLVRGRIYAGCTSDKPYSTCTLGIYGMGGIGKTTLAKAIYNDINKKFDGASFIDNVSGMVTQAGLVGVQQALLESVLHTKVVLRGSTEVGRQLLRERLQGKKVLIILDNINKEEQLDHLLPSGCRLRDGSQIVITTRDENMITRTENIMERANSEDYKVRTSRFPMETLSLENARRLFKWHAFLSDQVPKPLAADLEELVDVVVDLCAGLPLSLKVFGSHMYKKTNKIEWERLVQELQAPSSNSAPIDPHEAVMNNMKLSYHTLATQQKTMFLDIVCFLLGEHEDRVLRIFPDANALYHLDRLKQKCLVKVSVNKKLMVHDILRDMARSIVCEENPNVFKRTHLWEVKDVRTVLRKKKGTDNVRGVSLTLKDEDRLETSSFASMDGLKLLVLSGGNLVGDFGCISTELKWFQWRRCPLQSLALSLALDNVTILDMMDSKIETLSVNTTASTFHSSVHQNQPLKELNLSGCSNLKELNIVPGEWTPRELEVLNLAGCDALLSLPQSLLCPTLIYLDMRGCNQIQVLPESLGQLTLLSELCLDDMRSLSSLPESLGNLVSLTRLLLRGCPNLQRIPSASFQGLSSLVVLHLEKCERVEELPSTIANLTNLTSLTILKCRNLREFPIQAPDDFCKLKSLKSIFLRFNRRISKLPESIHCLPNLESLTLNNVQHLREICRLPTTLQTLDLGNCPSLREVTSTTALRCLRELNLSNCFRLETFKILEEPPKDLWKLNISGCRSLVDVPCLKMRTSISSLHLAGSRVSLPDR